MNLSESVFQSLRTISKPVWWIFLLLVADFFLLNRFDVPYSIRIDGWRVDPISMATLVIFTGLWWFYREQPGRAWTRPEKVSLWALLAWFFIAFLTTLAHPRDCSPNYAGLACLATIGMWMLLVFVIPSLLLHRKDVVAVLWAFLGLACIGVLINVFVLLIPHLVSWFAGWEKPPAEGRAFLPLGVSTVLGCVFAMGIPLAMGLYFSSSRTRLVRMTTVVACLLLIIGVITTVSRASTVITILVLVVSFGVMSDRTVRSHGFYFKTVIGLIAVVISLVMVSERSRLVSFYDSSIQWRIRGASLTLKMFADYPLLGSGVENLLHRSSTGRLSSLFTSGMETVIYENRLNAREPHNLYLLTAAETGIAGLALLMLYLGSNLWIPVNKVKTISFDADKVLLKGMAICILVVLLQSITESMLLARPRFAILIGILWGTFRRYARVCDEK